MATQLVGVPYAQLPTAAKAAAALAQPPRLVVIHDTSNSATAAAEARYAATRPLDGATSAHFYVDGAGPLGSVPLNKQAWAAYSYANSHGWHIEMCGYNAGMTGAVPAKTIAITAILVRQLCQLGGIPMVKLRPAEVADGQRGICGHWDITTGLGVGTHDDPGPEFDWPAFIAAVNGDDMTPEEFIAAYDKGGTFAARVKAAPWGYQDTGQPNAHDILLKPDGELRGALRALLARPPAPPATVDPAALKAVLLDPQVLAAIAAAVLDAEAARLAE